jgi:alkaline phosphatase D
LQGVVQTGKGHDYTVKTQLNDKSELAPFTIYYYRFICQRTASKTGRFKTLPSPDQDLDRLRFGYTSCWELHQRLLQRSPVHG